METSDAPLRIERDGDVAVVVLDHPPLNLFTGAVLDALEHVAAELVALTDPSQPSRARAVLFEAHGKVVSGGVDVRLFQAIAESAEPARRGADLWTRLLQVAQTIEDLPVPTVFAAHGLTLTAAFELALACDILLAAESAVLERWNVVNRVLPDDGFAGAARAYAAQVAAGPTRAHAATKRIVATAVRE